MRIKLEKIKLVPSELADDSTFQRRLWLDTIGTLPSPEEIRMFLADPAGDKRAQWIDLILDRPEYANYWALVWADILLVDRQKLGERGLMNYIDGCRNSLRQTAAMTSGCPS